MNAIEAIEQGQMLERPDLRPGLTVRVHVKIREGEKERSTEQGLNAEHESLFVGWA